MPCHARKRWAIIFCLFNFADGVQGCGYWLNTQAILQADSSYLLANGNRMETPQVLGEQKFVKKSWRVCCAKSIFAMWHHVHLEHEIVWARIPAQIPSRKKKTCVQICFSCMDLPASQAASKLFINGSTRTVRITWCKKPLEGMQRISMVNS